VALKDGNGVVLYHYVITIGTGGACELMIKCDDNGRFYSHARSMDVDLFDDVQQIELHKNVGTWYRC
jgi:hypothetical protein